MYNPLFTPRFGVLLEAYLKGCGQSMLQRFENQLEMQLQLEEIGKQVNNLIYACVRVRLLACQIFVKLQCKPNYSLCFDF